MPDRKLFRSALAPLLVLAIFALAACGGKSGGFEEEMKPLLFQQAQLALDIDALLDPVFEEISTLGDLAAAAQSFSERRQDIHKYHQDFIEIKQGWESLEPPSGAEVFHRRAMEMISLRENSIRNLVSAVENAVSTGQIDTSLLLDAGSKWSAALAIWPEILAEANSFNTGDLDD